MTAPTFDPGPCEGLSAYQIAYVRALPQRPEFDRFVLVDGDPARTFSRSTPGPLNVLWYDKQGELHLVRVGRGRPLREVVTSDALLAVAAQRENAS